MKKIFTLLTLLMFIGVGKTWGTPTTVFNAADAGWAADGVDLTTGTTTVGDVTWYGRSMASPAIQSDNHTFADDVNFTKYFKPGGKSTYKSGSTNAGVLTYTPSTDGIIKVYLKGGGSGDRIIYLTQSAATSTANDPSIAIATVNAGNDYAILEAFVEKDKQVVVYFAQTVFLYGMTFEESNSDLTPSTSSTNVAVSGTTDITYTTSSTGIVTVSSSNDAIATAAVTSTNTITITGVAEGSATITIDQAADATYTKGQKKITVTVYDASNYYTLSTTSASISLNKTNINDQTYLAVTTNNWSTGSDSYDEIDPPFYNMSSVGRDLTIKVIGVKGFVVRNFSSYTGTARTYGISVNGEEKAVVTHGGTGVESSPVIATGSTDAVTIKLSGKGTGSTYPVRIILYANIESIPIGATGWSTYSTDKALDFGNAEAGIEAYQVTGYEGTAITKEQITGTVAANTGLLVKGTPSTSYVVPVVASGTNYPGNMMVESVSGGTVNAGDMGVVNYVLMNDGYGNAVFKWIGSTPATLGANKAYLSIPGGPTPAGARGLSIDDEVTAIKNIKVGTEDNVYYDLNGRRVLYPTKGLYIVNGKKLVIK